MTVRKKLYVNVNADHRPDGTCTPRSITLSNDETFEIDRVTQARLCASEVGGRGMRYTIRIGQSETHLFEEKGGRWFVEAKMVV